MGRINVTFTIFEEHKMLQVLPGDFSTWNMLKYGKIAEELENLGSHMGFWSSWNVQRHSVWNGFRRLTKTFERIQGNGFYRDMWWCHHSLQKPLCFMLLVDQQSQTVANPMINPQITRGCINHPQKVPGFVKPWCGSTERSPRSMALRATATARRGDAMRDGALGKPMEMIANWGSIPSGKLTVCYWKWPFNGILGWFNGFLMGYTLW